MDYVKFVFVCVRVSECWLTKEPKQKFGFVKQIMIEV